MRKFLLPLITIAFMTFWVSEALADCADGTESCPNGAVGWSNYCYHKPSWKPFRPFGLCEKCGHFCPSTRKVDKMPHKVYASINVLTQEQKRQCRQKILNTEHAIDGCSVPLKDPASKAFKNIFDDGACTEHDLCYRTPGITQEECDSNFRKNMKWSCKDYYMGQLSSHPALKVLNAAQESLCLTASDVWANTVRDVSGFAEVHVDNGDICGFTYEVDQISITNKGAFATTVQVKWGDGAGLDVSDAFAKNKTKTYTLTKKQLTPGWKFWVRAKVLGALKYTSGISTNKDVLIFKPNAKKTAHFTIYGATGQWSIIFDKITSR